MVALYLTSPAAGAGKTALCAGIAQQLRNQGKRVGFLKPILLSAQEPPPAEDEDARFMAQALELEEPAQSLCPAALTSAALEEALAQKQDGLIQKVQSAYARVSQGKDVVLLEGLSGLRPGSGPALASSQIVAALEAKAVVVTRYQGDSTRDEMTSARQLFQGRLLGGVINAVPQRQMSRVRSLLVPSLEESGIKVLGVIPEDRVLAAASVGELAQHLGGKVLTAPEKGDELVENLMGDALCLDPGLDYFNRKTAKAVISHGERPDMHLAALETPTLCLIITGDIPPIPQVLSRAQEKGVTIIAVKEDMPSILGRIEQALGNSRFHQEKKLKRLSAILAQNLEFKALYSGLGLN